MVVEVKSIHFVFFFFLVNQVKVHFFNINVKCSSNHRNLSKESSPTIKQTSQVINATRDALTSSVETRISSKLRPMAVLIQTVESSSVCIQPC